MDSGSAERSGRVPVCYRIAVRGEVTERFAEVLEGVFVDSAGAESILRVESADQAKLLLDAKISVPQARSSWVSRADLIETALASGCRVVAVTAPAGYGKSILLAQWAVAEDRRVAWVSLDRFDEDPTVLLTLLASAYARISPGNADLVADVGDLGVSSFGRASPRRSGRARFRPCLCWTIFTNYRRQPVAMC